MIKEITDKIVKELDKIVVSSKGKAKFSKQGYKSFEFNKKNYRKVEAKDSEIQVCFIDGGNSEIVGTTNFSLQLVRVYGCVFSGNKKIKDIRNEFFVLVRAKGGKEIKYYCDMFPIKGDVLADKLEFDSMDPTIKDGVFRAKIGKIGEIVRRFSEIRLAEEMCEKGIVVLDGTLEGNYPDEEKYLERLFNKGVEKDVLITALAKTNNIFTEKGDNWIAVLNCTGMWCYYPTVEIKDDKHKAEMYFVKLNDKSEHVFRFEVFKEQKMDIDKVMGQLAKNSIDIGFPGYPYGLIRADKLARVSNKEKEHYKVVFMAKTGKKLEKYLNSANAHQILDSQN